MDMFYVLIEHILQKKNGYLPIKNRPSSGCIEIFSKPCRGQALCFNWSYTKKKKWTINYASNGSLTWYHNINIREYLLFQKFVYWYFIKKCKVNYKLFFFGHFNFSLSIFCLKWWPQWAQNFSSSAHCT